MGINGKKSARPTGALKRYRAEKRENADARQVVRDLRSTHDQLKVLDSRPGASRRERTRLERELSQ
jgi:hypothetical protein